MQLCDGRYPKTPFLLDFIFSNWTVQAQYLLRPTTTPCVGSVKDKVFGYADNAPGIEPYNTNSEGSHENRSSSLLNWIRVCEGIFAFYNFYLEDRTRSQSKTVYLAVISKNLYESTFLSRYHFDKYLIVLKVAGRGNPQPRVKCNNLERKNIMAGR